MEPVDGLDLPVALAQAVRARAAECGLPVGRTLVELVEAGLASARCRHPARPAPDPPAEDDEDAE